MSENKTVGWKSPMSYISNSNQELFHSNFLFWIAECYPDYFRGVISKLLKGEDLLGNGKCWTARREYHHFDFSISWGSNPDDIALVLENKVKSVPHKKQLDEYKSRCKGLNAKFLLLSLVTEFPRRDDIEKDWIIASYKDLYNALYEAILPIPDKIDTYARLIIEDYCNYISMLDKMVCELKASDTDKIIEKLQCVEQNNEYQNSIKNIALKVVTSQLCAKLSSRLEHELPSVNFSDKDLTPLEISSDFKKNVGKVFVNFDHSAGRSDFYVRIPMQNKDERYIIMIDIIIGRDNHSEYKIKYAHMVQKLKSSSNTNDDWNLVKKIPIVEKIGFLGTKDLNYHDDDSILLKDNLYPKNSSKEFDQYKGPKKYNYVYQYYLVKDDATVKLLLDLIVRETKILLNEIV